MKLALFAAFLLPCAAAVGNTSGPASAHAHQDEHADTKAVLATVNAVFAAFEVGDADAMLRQVYPDGRVTASGMRGDGASAGRSPRASVDELEAKERKE